MAVFSAPKEVGDKPEFSAFGHDFTKYTAATEKWIKAVKDFCKKHGSSECKGEEIHFPVADGSARYVVFSLRPIKLIHLPVYDGWQFQYAHRLTAADIRQQVKSNKSLKAMFAGRGK